MKSSSRFPRYRLRVIAAMLVVLSAMLFADLWTASARTDASARTPAQEYATLAPAPGGGFKQPTEKPQFAVVSVSDMKKAQESLPVVKGPAIPFHREPITTVASSPASQALANPDLTTSKIVSMGQTASATAGNSPAPIVFTGRSR